MASGAGWYGQNVSRSYPINDGATRISDEGTLFPENVLADIKLRFMGAQVEVPYVSRIIVGDFIGIVISVSNEAIAAASIARSNVEIGVPIELSSLARNTRCSVVFGELYDEQKLDLSFSSAAQSGITPMCYYAQFGSPTTARFGIRNRRVDGLKPYYIIGGTDIQVGQKFIDIDGVTRWATVFEIISSTDVINPVDPVTSNANKLIEYAGPCGKRPDSRSCDDPQPIETINGVGPDCCGRIFIELRGCGNIYPIEETCGIAIDCGFNVTEACPTPTNVPDENGELPGEGSDSCDSGTGNNASSGQNTTTSIPWWRA